jgi:hypothetical protein
LRSKVETRVMADRAALLTAAATRGTADYEPLNVAEHLEAWDKWLSTDPTTTDEAQLERWARELLEAG